MKKIFALVALLFAGANAFGQMPRSNPGLDSLKTIKDPALLNGKLQALGKGSEEDLGLLLSYYSRNRSSADSITQIALQRFPKGKIAMGRRTLEANAEKDPVLQEKSYLALQKDYPQESFSSLLFTLSYNYANAKNGAKAIEYLQKVEGRNRSNALAMIPAIVMGYDQKLAENFVAKELSSTSITKDERTSLLGIQSQIFTKKGDFANAFTSMKEFYGQTLRKTPDLTAKYYYLLSKTGGQVEAFPFLEKAVSEGLGGDEIKTELTLVYEKLNPGKNGKLYLADLEKKYQERYTAETAAKMISEPAPNFTVSDVSGKKVSLSDFKDKIIVLDFWATWCGPCKRSLPAMQMAVNKYKADPNVKFLFIHTWENVADPTSDAKAYFKDNNFDLPLYMDVKDAATKKNPAVSAFDVKGIPAKFVIDGKGNVRFKMSGFGGTNEAAVAELTAMIELSRQAS